MKRAYFVTYVGEIPAGLHGIIDYVPKLATDFVVVFTDKTPAELMKITGVKSVKRADTLGCYGADLRVSAIESNESPNEVEAD